MKLTFSPGALLIYHNRSAVLTGVSGEKLEIRTEEGAGKSVRLKDVKLLHPGPVSALPPQEPCKPELEEVRELMGEETLPFADFAELVYSDNSTGAFYGAWLLLNDGTWFTGSVEDGVKCRSKEEIEAALSAAKAKSDAKKNRGELLERIRSGNLLPEDHTAMREVEFAAYGTNSASRIMHDLGIEPTPEKAHALLLKTGVWTELNNPYPVRNGIELKDPELAVGPLPEEVREDLTHLRAYAIDNEGSSDPDDAISFADGLLWVHIADPAAIVTPDSELDLCGRTNGENLYLPEKILHMLPPAMTEVFGLGLQEKSPALSFAVKITEEGDVRLEKMTLSLVKVERFTYESARSVMEQEDFLEMQKALERFRKKREVNGALLIRLPEVDLKVRDGKVELHPCPVTPERELVANAMLAAGAAVGQYAAEQEIAMPFAAQPAAEELPEEIRTLSGMYQARKCCSPGFISAFAEPHAGLGLNAYVRVTSPLRRYTDLLAHQQIRKILAGEEPFTAEQLSERFPSAEKEGILRRKTERISNEFWTLVYLKQHPGWSGEAIVVQHLDDRTVFLIPELAYEFKMRGFTQIPENSSVQASLTNIDLPLLSSRFSIKQS